MFDRIAKLMEKTKGIQAERNLFVHGSWIIGKAGDSTLICADTRWKIPDSSLQRDVPLNWNRFSTSEWTLDRFEEFSKRIGELNLELVKLIGELQSRKIPMLKEVSWTATVTDTSTLQSTEIVSVRRADS